MSTPARPLHRYTYADYLALEKDSPIKHEFLAGEIYAMAGGTPEHAALAAAVTALLGAQLAGKPCVLFSSDLRVRVVATGLATYPDVSVVCGELARDPESRITVINPKVVVEVTSDSTEDYDRGEKLAHYKQIETLEECVLVSHRSRLLEVWRREAGGEWRHESARAGDSVTLASLGCALRVDEVYRAGLVP